MAAQALHMKQETKKYEKSRSVIHNWAIASNNMIFYKAGYTYNKIKEAIGLESGIGTLVDPSYGRIILYQEKMATLAAERLQKAFETGELSFFFEKGKEHPHLKGLSEIQLKTLLGGKGYGLYKMTSRLRIPVPEAFTLPAWMCSKLEVVEVDGVKRKKLTEAQKKVIDEKLAEMERRTGKKFGDVDNPLFVSCRSGARDSMPGMMETILNIGLTKDLLEKLVAKALASGDTAKARFWMDSYCTLLAQFGNVVYEITSILNKQAKAAGSNVAEIDYFENAKERLKKQKGYSDDAEMTYEDLCGLAETFEGFYQKAEKVLPADYREQFYLATETVFDSWDIPRAKYARNEMGIPDYLGTAVNSVEMVFGNKGIFSGTGVLFTRDKDTGEKVISGSVLFNAQGEQVVSGVRDALSLEALRDGYVTESNFSENSLLRKKAKIILNRLRASNIIDKNGVINTKELTEEGLKKSLSFSEEEKEEYSSIIKNNIKDISDREKALKNLTVVLSFQSEEMAEVLRVLNDSRTKLNKIYNELIACANKLEEDAVDMQDVEFTIEQDEQGNPKLFLLQTRNGKRSGEASVKIAMDLYNEGKISAEEALMRVEPEKFKELLAPKFDLGELKKAVSDGRLLGKGTAGTMGAAYGEIIFDPLELAAKIAEQNGMPDDKRKHYILVRPMTMQDDVPGMRVSDGVLTQTGSKVCHAVIMTTMWGVPCVVSFKDMEFIEEDGRILGIKIKGKIYDKGTELSINGTTGDVILGKIKTIKPKELSSEAGQLLALADNIRRLKIRANTELDKAQDAYNFGARGVGLVRTEHMFLDRDQLHNVRLMFLKYLEYIKISGKDAGSHARKARLMDDLKPILQMLERNQENDFYEIYKINDGEGVTGRLLDAPLHEFSPKREESKNQLALDLNISREELDQRLESFHESDPMLGFRSARMGIVFPEIYKSQVKAMLRAAGRLIDEGKNPKVEIEIPLVSQVEEIEIIRKIVEAAAAEITQERQGRAVDYRLGVMIETPAAALNGKRVAKALGPKGFVSVGSNDLTQMTKGLSRDDAEIFLQIYAANNMYNYGKKHPFLSLDPDVVRLIRIFVEEARSVYPDFEIGICGEHGGDPYSIGVLNELGLNIISMSAYGVPSARLAAARAEIERINKSIKLPLIQVLMAGNKFEGKPKKGQLKKAA